MTENNGNNNQDNQSNHVGNKLSNTADIYIHNNHVAIVNNNKLIKNGIQTKRRTPGLNISVIPEK